MTDPSSPPYVIPQDLIDKWLSLPANEPVSVTLTRGDFDRLYNAFDAVIAAQAQFQQAMVAYTNGEDEAANLLHQTANQSLINAQSSVRRLFGSIMGQARSVDER